MHWLMPQGIEDLLPREAAVLEKIRRLLLQLFDSWGYQLVIPPMLENTDTLLEGLGSDLENQTFKLTDPLSGKTLGIRADMTPQVARIDTCYMPQDVPSRLCYLDNTLTAYPGSLHSTRSPLQVGADIFGHTGTASDTEVIRLMITALQLLGLDSVCLNLGHVGIYRGLAAKAGLRQDQERKLFEILQKKSRAGTEEYLRELEIEPAYKSGFLLLLDLHGDQQVLQDGQRLIEVGGEAIQQAIENLSAITAEIEMFLPQVRLYFDLAELRGYHYHTGVVFAAYSEGLGQAVAVGGRYDGTAKSTGHKRPATGFSADIKKLAPLTNLALGILDTKRIGAPWRSDPQLQEKIGELRNAGYQVINLLPGQQFMDPSITHRLDYEDGEWRVQPLQR